MVTSKARPAISNDKSKIIIQRYYKTSVIRILHVIHPEFRMHHNHPDPAVKF